MQAIPVQQDNVTSLAADDFNPIPRELENFIETSGQVLSGGDLNQVGKAAAAYAGGADFYTDAGAADAYDLAAIGGKMLPPAYFLGLRVRFKVANTNTLTAITVKLGALATKAVSQVQVPNAGTPLIAVGDMPVDEIVELVYDQTPDTLINYWRMVSVSTINTRGTKSATRRATDTTFADSADVSSLVLRPGTGSGENALEYTSGDSGRLVKINAAGTDVVAPPGSSYTLETFNNGKGISYLGGGGGQAQNIRTHIYDASGMAWSPLGAAPAADHIWASFTNVLLTGIDHHATNSFSYDVRLRWRSGAGEFNVPLSCSFVDNAGTWELTEAWFLGNNTWDPDALTDQELVVTFNAFYVD